MDSFSLDIDLGNAAMSTRDHVARALRQAADAVEHSAVSHTEGFISDENGNRVGGWGFDQLADKRPGPCDVALEDAPAIDSCPRCGSNQTNASGTGREGQRVRYCEDCEQHFQVFDMGE